MTLTPWTSIFIALAFALPFATAFLDEFGLDFKLKTELQVPIPGYDHDQPFILNYSLPSPTHAFIFTVRDPRDQVIHPIMVPRQAHFYRQNTVDGILLVYTPRDVQEMADYTTIELNECRSAGQNAYVRLADIESGTGHVYLAPGSEHWQLPEGCVHLGILGMQWPQELLEMSVEEGEPGPRGPQGFLIGTLLRVLPLGAPEVAERNLRRGVYWVCQCVNGIVFPAGAVLQAARGFTEIEHGKLLLATFDIGLGVAMLGTMYAVHNALKICIANLYHPPPPTNPSRRQEIRRLS